MTGISLGFPWWKDKIREEKKPSGSKFYKIPRSQVLGKKGRENWAPDSCLFLSTVKRPSWGERCLAQNFLVVINSASTPD